MSARESVPASARESVPASARESVPASARESVPASARSRHAVRIRTVVDVVAVIVETDVIRRVILRERRRIAGIVGDAVSGPRVRVVGREDILAHRGEEVRVGVVVAVGTVRLASFEVVLAQARAGHRPARVGLGASVTAEAGDGSQSGAAGGRINEDRAQRVRLMADVAITTEHESAMNVVKIIAPVRTVGERDVRAGTEIAVTRRRSAAVVDFVRFRSRCPDDDQSQRSHQPQSRGEQTLGSHLLFSSSSGTASRAHVSIVCLTWKIVR